MRGRILSIIAILGPVCLTAGVVAAFEMTRASAPSDAEIAQQHLQSLAGAMWLYANEYGEVPSDPALLYPGYVSDPILFWSPGDSDPAPTTIDNSTPNAVNSARVSFEFAATIPVGDEPIVWDNTADNNGGFVSMVIGGTVWTDPPLATPSPTANQLSQQGLTALAAALHRYANDHRDRYPQDMLQMEVTPRQVWHPGDSDPLPAVLTHSVLDAPDSVQVSYEYLAAGLTTDDVALDSIVFRDNSAANNGGAFVGMVTVDGVYETDPPAVTLTPSKIALAQAHLKRFRVGLHLGFSHGPDDRLPDDLRDVFDTYMIATPRTFWNPGDSDSLPSEITNSLLDAPNSAQVSFEYLTPGVLYSDLADDDIVLRDNTPANNEGLGVNALRADGRVVFIPVRPFGDFDQDCHIDLADFAVMQRQVAWVATYIEDPAYRIFDWDFDSQVTLSDFDAFSDAMTGPNECAPECLQ